jgi:DNA-binding NtrC family response regulator
MKQGRETGRPPLKILLVEDSWKTDEGLSILLTRNGYSVASIPPSLSFLTAFSVFHPDIVLIKDAPMEENDLGFFSAPAAHFSAPLILLAQGAADEQGFRKMLLREGLNETEVIESLERLRDLLGEGKTASSIPL